LLPQIGAWWFQFSTQVGGGKLVNRSIYCADAEIRLVRDFVSLLTDRAKDTDSWSTPPKRAPIPAEWRKHFVRVLFPPLFAHGKVAAAAVSMTHVSLLGTESVGDVIERFKAEGNASVKKNDLSSAVESYRRALGRYHRTDWGKTTDTTALVAARRTAAQCYLNLAHCHIELGGADEEAALCCDEALRLIDPSDHALITKAHYRKGRALEQHGHLEAAASALEVASALEAAGVSGAAARVLARVRAKIVAARP